MSNELQLGCRNMRLLSTRMPCAADAHTGRRPVNGNYRGAFCAPSRSEFSEGSSDYSRT